MNKSHLTTCFSSSIQEFLEHWHTLGCKCHTDEFVLWSINDYIALSHSQDLDRSTFELWCSRQKERGLSPNSLRLYQNVVRKFCLYRSRTQTHCFVPERLSFSKPRPHISPFILQPEDVYRVLAKIGDLPPTPSSPLIPDVLRLAVILLYTSGLRIGEVLRLTLGDVKPDEGLLYIDRSKFHKSRLVPLSDDTSKEMSRYLEKRLSSSLDTSPGSSLLGSFFHGVWKGYTDQSLRTNLKNVLRSAAIVTPEGRCPRVHDFRHSFAVQALLRWYRAGVDVQSKLPVLSHYMGHVSIASTAYYLQWIPDIATEANLRFERYSGLLVNAGGAQ